ncbi:MAG: integrase core domain-containing protein, partial [Oscillospiraceae bacterium]|nr:integrase core domain-containing protein [Oscillospiraceae bacterium]
IPPRTPWHNGKVERSHRNDQRYFYDWEKFGSVQELNEKLREHLRWTNRKTMRTLGRKSPLTLLREKLKAA